MHAAAFLVIFCVSGDGKDETVSIDLTFSISGSGNKLSPTKITKKLLTVKKSLSFKNLRGSNEL